MLENEIISIKKENNILGIHGYQRHPKVTNSKSKVYEYQSDLATKEDCYDLVDRFVESADGINGLIQSHGNINRSAIRPICRFPISKCDTLNNRLIGLTII